MHRLLINALFLLLLLGCHTIRFELADAAHGEVVHQRKSFFFWGLTPYREIDVLERCPAGAAAIREETSFTDGLMTFWTLGIWQVRSSWYYCLPETGGGTQP